MRYFLMLALMIGGTVGGYLTYRNLTAGPPVVLAAPVRLQVADGNVAVNPGGWATSHAVVLQVRADTSTGVDVEVRPAGHKFTDTPTKSVQEQAARVAANCNTKASCPPAAGAPPVHIHLADGTYHWQARLHNGEGVSPWVPYHGMIHVDATPPQIAELSSPTDPKPKTVYHSGDMRFDWSGSDTGSGLAGYSYRLDTDAHGQALAHVRTNATTVSMRGLDTGQYYFHVRALDHAGNWGASQTFPVHVDVTPPGLAHVSFSTYTFDPLYGRLSVSFAVTRPTKTVRIGFYRQSDNFLTRLYVLHNVQPGKIQTVTWDGKGEQGGYVTAGDYAVYVRPIDPYGHSSLAGWRDLVLEYKRIVVSLSQQKLWAYDGSNVFLTSLVTTGNKALPTPTGVFHILAKFHPFTFKSPWPKSSPYWYPPSPTQYAMMFQSGGYYIHDAPWRSVFGPGSNAQLGTPGQNYTGTHGCINVPANVAKELFGWADIGTDVIVKQ